MASARFPWYSAPEEILFAMTETPPFDPVNRVHIVKVLRPTQPNRA